MLFTWKTVPFPKPRKRRFAFVPTIVGMRDGHKVYAWLGFYETRTVNYLCYERRSMRDGDAPVTIDYGDLAES